MAGFRFPLEPVLAYKENVVELCQIELLRLEREAREARLVRDGLIAEIRQSYTSLQALLHQDRLDVEAMRRIELYQQGLSMRLEQQHAVVADLERRVAGKREELLRLQQDQEILEGLKRRQQRRFERRLERAEAQLIDESAIAGFNRRRSRDQADEGRKR